MNTIFLLVSLPLFSQAQNCATYAKCASPTTDILGLVPCRLTSVLDAAGIKNVTQSLMTQVCNGSTIDDIGSNFMNTMQKGASSTTYGKILAAMPNFESCLSKYSSSFDKALTQIGAGFKAALGAMYTTAQAKVATYKGQCTSSAMYNTLSVYSCPLFNKTTIQKVINATKPQMGNSWVCVPTKLSPSILNFTGYIV